MKIELVVGRYDRMIGLAWYAASLQKYLSWLGKDIIITQPDYLMPIQVAGSVIKPFRFDLITFFTNYPISVHVQKNSIKHLTTQQMASLFTFTRDLHPVIVTVHDIIPYMMRDDPEQNNYNRFYERWIDRLAMNNLRYADRIITDSDYTKRMLIEHLKIAPEKIRVILLGLDLEVFKPIDVSDDFREKYHLNAQLQYILYVGSELPRKNLNRLLEAFAMVKIKNPNARLIKIGSAVRTDYYQKFLDNIQKLNLSNEVILFNHVSRSDLILFYNIADVFVFPSLYEGFGIPPLEAMACGAAVICSDSASLPEVVGDAAISVNPFDICCWANTITDVLNNNSLRNNLRERSLARASQFSWERMAHETLNVYAEVAG